MFVTCNNYFKALVRYQRIIHEYNNNSELKKINGISNLRPLSTICMFCNNELKQCHFWITGKHQKSGIYIQINTLAWLHFALQEFFNLIETVWLMIWVKTTSQWCRKETSACCISPKRSLLKLHTVCQQPTSPCSIPRFVCLNTELAIGALCGRTRQNINFTYM